MWAIYAFVHKEILFGYNVDDGIRAFPRRFGQRESYPLLPFINEGTRRRSGAGERYSNHQSGNYRHQGKRIGQQSGSCRIGQRPGHYSTDFQCPSKYHAQRA